MEIDIEGGLRVSINEKDKTASIIESPKATGIVLIPKFAKYNNIQYLITSISEKSFNRNYIEFLTFPEDSEVESFKMGSLLGAHIKKLRIPPKLKYLGSGWCHFLCDLTEIEISPKNHSFIYFENKYLLGKSEEKSDKFDSLYITRRDIEEAVIPSQIKTIKYLAFNALKSLKRVVFAPNSELEHIEGFAFNGSSIEYLEVTAKSVKIGDFCFGSCSKLSVLSFPNAEKITLDCYSTNGIPGETKILVRRDAILNGSVKDLKSRIEYIEERESGEKDSTKVQNTKEEKELPKKDESEVRTDNGQKKKIETLEHENATLKKYVKYLQSRLSRYEESLSYEDFTKTKEEVKPSNSTNEYEYEYEYEGNKEEYETREKYSNIGPEDEEFQEVLCKIGEGSSSEVFKVHDKRRQEMICKKVIKECDESVSFKTLQNSVKEIEASESIRHPCICELLGYNMQEELSTNKQGDDEDISDDEEKEEQEENKQSKDNHGKTTIALFFELLPFSVKEVIDKGLMSNTLKVRISVEVAFAMSHIHRHGMMHRDLKLENVMLNSVFESKLIDFGLVHFNDISGSNSLTKGVGTLAYMSPEMVNEEDYDEKTDVYSYGIFLFALFSGRVPKQSMRDKMNGVDMKYPTASSKISDICINLIKKCTSFKSSIRPSFDEIIEYMFNNRFCLAAEVDVKLIVRRYRELNRFRRSIIQTKK
ncbi:hypothetical protein M9Y10_015718 [Tritrichomonas musculus]|uniref:Protein kinase domain-containing protein n=1 Tax=Tritrichomonas musculus TaxID=1915356 RepID=A0ABR2L3Y7_9EUKA